MSAITDNTKIDNSIIIDTSGCDFGGKVRAIASKSHAHRLLISAALSDGELKVLTPDSSKDIIATLECLNGLGANIEKLADCYTVSPILHEEDEIPQIDCGESGSTLRFIIPVIGALGCGAEITMHGRLPERPLSPMYEELTRHGLKMSEQGSNPFYIDGQLSGGDYTIAGNVSSQFITGLLFALPITETDSNLHVTGKLESRPYVDITLDVIRRFGITVNEEALDNGEVVFHIPGNQTYHSDADIAVDGDWSNAAFFLAAGAIGPKAVTVTGLNTKSLQGDMKIIDLLKDFGADISEAPSESIETTVSGLSDITVTPAELHGIEIDAADIPDLVPILSVVAACANGTTTIRNIERLRIKESDRVQTVISTLSTLGSKIYEADAAIVIEGNGQLTGGILDSFNDHRIAMSGAIAALRCSGPVQIQDPMAVEKSYPLFYQDFQSLIQ